jgi:hypothetical protein
MDVVRESAVIVIDINDNKVSSIAIYSGLDMFQQHIDLGLNLNDVINSYGEPSDIFFSSGCGGDVVCLNINLVYPEQGVLVAVELSNLSDDLQILPTLPVRALIFFKPPNFKESLLLLPNIYDVDCDLSKYMILWPGYTSISLENGFANCR